MHSLKNRCTLKVCLTDVCSSYLCGLNIIQIIEKVAQLSAVSYPVSGHAESVV